MAASDDRDQHEYIKAAMILSRQCYKRDDALNALSTVFKDIDKNAGYAGIATSLVSKHPDSFRRILNALFVVRLMTLYNVKSIRCEDGDFKDNISFDALQLAVSVASGNRSLIHEAVINFENHGFLDKIVGALVASDRHVAIWKFEKDLEYFMQKICIRLSLEGDKTIYEYRNKIVSKALQAILTMDPYCYPSEQKDNTMWRNPFDYV